MHVAVPKKWRKSYKIKNKNREEEVKKTVLGYNVYRRNTLNDNAPELLAEKVTDTTYTDATWNTMTMGLYQWGVAVIYDAGDDTELTTEIAEVDNSLELPVKKEEKSVFLAFDEDEFDRVNSRVNRNENAPKQKTNKTKRYCKKTDGYIKK